MTFRNLSISPCKYQVPVRMGREVCCRKRSTLVNDQYVQYNGCSRVAISGRNTDISSGKYWPLLASHGRPFQS